MSVWLPILASDFQLISKGCVGINISRTILPKLQKFVQIYGHHKLAASKLNLLNMFGL